ncbi:carbohydrate binding domain-containing protein, partial [Klebsiella pneumoniae]|uniref:carbohydrate binding domain-containing protein n=1 Tax=Klebsiella pneumoniae TaxID=573 RepID=UPI001D17F5A5
ASDQNIAFSINVLLTAGNFYFDDIFFVDVTDEINNAANATAITNLTTRVTSAEGKITSQGTAITQLTSDLSTANGKITANANAITSLKSTVTQQGNPLTTQGQAITKLNSDLSDLSGVVDTKASASAVSQLTTRVTNAEGKITSQGQAITKLTSDLSILTGVVNSKADASALNALTTRVSSAEGKIASQGQSITQLTNSISNTESAMDAQGKIPGNLLANASFERGQVAFDGWSDLTDVIDATNPHSGGKILRMNAGASVKIGQSIEVTQGRRYRFGVFARQNAGTEIQDPANTKFRIADGSDNLLAAVNYGPFTTTWQNVSMDWTASKNTVAKFQLTAFLKSGSMYFDDVYVVDITNETNIKGNADAITSLNTKVTQQGNDITSQSNAITNLSNSLKTQQYANSNPWIDGSFESYSDGQALSGANAVVTTEYAFSGSKSLKCRRADGETGNSDKMFGYETSIREEAVYRYECWAMMPEGETPPNGWGCNVGMIVRTAAG